MGVLERLVRMDLPDPKETPAPRGPGEKVLRVPPGLRVLQDSQEYI